LLKYTYLSTNKRRRIVVIGGVAAGTSAASKARRIDPEADIKIIQDEKVVSYAACGIPYVIEGLINSFEKLIERPPDIFKSKYGIDIIVNTRAHKIDRIRKQVYTTDLHSGKETIFDYDSLVLATGARAVVPNLNGVNLEGVFFIRNYADGVRIDESTIAKNAHSCVIAGAGLFGLEMVEAFKNRASTVRRREGRGGGLDVTLVEMADHILPTMLDKSMAKTVEKELKDNGVEIILGERVEEILGTNGQVNGIKTNAKREINSDFIVLGTGVRPNSEIGRDAGVELGHANAIKVDEYMRTNISDILAAGDCATARNYITNKDMYLPLGTTANKQGRVAGENAAGGKVGCFVITILQRSSFINRGTLS
jgi:NADPH-dependent 2,4-dienoyl-CoA reductase/sulfur reductase-like enzyme